MEITEEKKLEVWNKGIVVENYDGSKYRHDACGAWIRYADYGDRESPFGWEIDHIYPAALLAKRGFAQEKIDDIINLRPLNWRNNVSKAHSYPSYLAAVKAVDDRNKLIETPLDINSSVQSDIKEFYNL